MFLCHVYNHNMTEKSCWFYFCSKPSFTMVVLNTFSEIANIISNIIFKVILFHSLQFERIQKLNFEFFKMWNRPFFLKDWAVFVVGDYIKPQTQSHPQIKKLYINVYPVLFHIPAIWPATIASGRFRVKESFLIRCEFFLEKNNQLMEFYQGN